MPKILLVDDHPGIRELLRMILAHRGHDVFIADCGRKAISLVEQSKPHIAVLDLHLPDMGGLELLAQIHRLDPEVSIIVLTGSDRATVLNRAQDLGATDVFQKGVSLQHLGRKIEQLV
jgi:CheY-like chemotaxis protein